MPESLTSVRAPALEVTPAIAAPGNPRSARWSAGRLGLGVVAALVVGWSLAPFVIVALDAARHHREFAGVSGYYPSDGLQYLAWARDAQNGLIRNLYGSATDHAVFVHPLWSLSGLAELVLGVGPAVVMGFWKLVSVAVLLGGCLRLVTRHIPRDRVGSRALALALAVFGGLTPVAALVAVLDAPTDAGADFTRAAFELTPALALWDYAPLAIALGLMPFIFERLERLVEGDGDRRLIATTALMTLLVAWLHPWQAETVIAVAIGLVVWRWNDRRRGRRDWRRPSSGLAVVLAAAAAPILYYLILSRIDAGWAVSERSSVVQALIPWPIFLSCVLPLFAVAALAARRAHDTLARPLVLWSLATMLTVAVSPSGQYRAIDGLAIPVAVLGVRAWRPDFASARRGLAGAAAVFGLLAPFAVFAVDAFGRFTTPVYRQYTELAASDVRAARVAVRFSGGRPIVAPIALGTAIPGLTDAPSWLGHLVWTPDVGERWEQATALFRGRLTAPQARAVVRLTGSRALVEPCGWGGRLASALAPLGFRAVPVGCARVYVRTGHNST